MLNVVGSCGGVGLGRYTGGPLGPRPARRDGLREPVRFLRTPGVESERYRSAKCWLQFGQKHIKQVSAVRSARCVQPYRCLCLDDLEGLWNCTIKDTLPPTDLSESTFFFQRSFSKPYFSNYWFLFILKSIKRRIFFVFTVCKSQFCTPQQVCNHYHFPVFIKKKWK